MNLLSEPNAEKFLMKFPSNQLNATLFWWIDCREISKNFPPIYALEHFIPMNKMLKFLMKLPLAHVQHLFWWIKCCEISDEISVMTLVTLHPCNRQTNRFLIHTTLWSKAFCTELSWYHFLIHCLAFDSLVCSASIAYTHFGYFKNEHGKRHFYLFIGLVLCDAISIYNVCYLWSSLRFPWLFTWITNTHSAMHTFFQAKSYTTINAIWQFVTSSSVTYQRTECYDRKDDLIICNLIFCDISMHRMLRPKNDLIIRAPIDANAFSPAERIAAMLENDLNKIALVILKSMHNLCPEKSACWPDFHCSKSLYENDQMK